jgi:hypothetical protein
MLINCNNFLSHLCIYSFSLNLISVEKLHQSWRGALHYNCNNPTSLIMDAHCFASFPILTHVVILFNS